VVRTRQAVLQVPSRGDVEDKRTFSVGDVCGHYEVRSGLDSEEAVELYQAADVVTGDAVTLECSRWGEDSEDLDMDRLLARGAAWHEAAGPHVIRVVDGGTTANGTSWLAHEPVPIDGVRARLDVGGAFPPALAVGVAEDVAEHLDAVLASGFVPASLTPHAVRLRDDGSVVLWLARLSTPTASSSPPEVLTGHEPDARAFVYGVALVLFEMLSGEHPFVRYVQKESDAEAAMKHAQCHREPVGLSELVPGLAPGVVATVRAALSKERAKRPPTLAVLATELARLREHVVGQAGELPTGLRPIERRSAPETGASERTSSCGHTMRHAALWGGGLGLGVTLLIELARGWLR